MDHGDPNQSRLIGDYILGPKVGSGSFAVVWRSRHRQLGTEVAVKEIDKKPLSPKVSDNVLKEISILSTINHPNIIRLFEAIQTEDRIFLVLEYCDGGDLADYIRRHGKVSETVARHFMRQLAAGLQVLQEKHLIHRDLKPQNLLLSTTVEDTPHLKIGDFGFARSLIGGLADTLCGSPLYMAPEIIQNQKYDAKADLWSVGAILFQLVTGKPPFDGNNQLQLFQNILTSTELRFPEGALEELHPDCVDLCRSLLRLNPVERLSFTEFFNHKFLRDSRYQVDIGHPSVLPPLQSTVEQPSSSVSDNILQMHFWQTTNSSITRDPKSQDQLRVSDSMESIEKDYVMVNSFSHYLESSLPLHSTTGASLSASKQKDRDKTVIVKTEEQVASSVGAESSQTSGSAKLPASCESTLLLEVQGLSILHPSTRLHLLHQYAQVLADLSQEKYNAGLFLDSFSVQLLVLAIWKKSIQICSTWLASSKEDKSPKGSSANESLQGGAASSTNASENVDFSQPSSVLMWAEQGFIVAVDRAEKLSYHIQEMDAGAAELPDAMEIIYQKALKVGTSGAVDEYMENKCSAEALYSKAMLLLSFIAGEATSLPLTPPFSLTPANKKRIQQYILNLESRRVNFLKSQPAPVQTRGSSAK
ncbi:serine/threonine-protein kinase ATG1a-like isoform X1 [Malus sylvestris]|uniref:serine/threonine-protein kinase ATG1a-like isoform X1 n=1 Tax=Malus sylvestris TaxID=3752 RepID=UPI0021AD40FC|nr:serine/threonine-protein kinase ATG1a-like isoform X1 [Malus sylvestris]XP_050147092.1 serine/threonine-protein kinase ATG1a-like isoform X1 [Malus sylvestris]